MEARRTSTTSDGSVTRKTAAITVYGRRVAPLKVRSYNIKRVLETKEKNKNKTNPQRRR